MDSVAPLRDAGKWYKNVPEESRYMLWNHKVREI
jgi:hypothetical protein